MMKDKHAPMVSRTAPKQALSWRLPQWKCSANQLLLAVFMLMLAGALYAAYATVNSVLTVPVENVVVKGELHYQEQQAIRDVIQQYSQDGFIKVNLKELYQKLNALPWLYRVSVKRQMPSGLYIEVQEQNAIAYWNDGSLINAYGEVFKPATLPLIEGLPRLAGDELKPVLALYQDLQNLLPESQQPIHALTVRHQHIVQVQLPNDVTLMLDKEQMQAQLKRWQAISKTLASIDFARIKQVDLRYSNGAAVEWKNQLAAKL